MANRIIDIWETFLSEQDARDYVERTLDRYPRAGYGTQLQVKNTDEGRWLVKGHRSESCE